METASPSNLEDVEPSGRGDGRGQSPAVPGAGVGQWAGPQPGPPGLAAHFPFAGEA